MPTGGEASAVAEQSQRSRARRRRRRLLGRSLALTSVALLALLYYRPVRTYFDRRAQLTRRQAEVRALARQNRTLARGVRRTATGAELVRQARLLGLVKPGERLFIVKGIDAWLRAARAGGSLVLRSGSP